MGLSLEYRPVFKGNLITAIRLVGRKVLVWLTFEKEVEVESKEGNHISIDVNENNVTLAVFEGFKLKDSSY